MNRWLPKFRAMAAWPSRLLRKAKFVSIFLFLAPGVAQAQSFSSCDFSGIWYSPAVPGDGFNIYQSESGWVIYFLGYDNWGLPFWATTDYFQPGALAIPGINTLPLLWGDYAEGTNFETPTPPDKLESWGTLDISFESCDRGALGLHAIDDWNFGSKTIHVTRLTSRKPESPLACDYSGIWYNPHLPGEGFNVFDTPSGVLVYFLGYDNFGTTIWTISDLVQSDSSPSGTQLQIPMFVGPYASGGDFIHPLPPGALESWGTLTIGFSSCTEGTFTLSAKNQNNFGSKVTNVVKLLSTE